MHFAVNLLITYLVKSYFQDNPCTLIITDNKIKLINIQGISYTPKEIHNYHLNNYCNSFLLDANNLKSIFDDLEYKIKNDGISGYGNRKYLIVMREDEIFDFLSSKNLNYLEDFLLVKVIYLRNCSKLYWFEEEIVLSLYTHHFDEFLRGYKLILLDEWFSVNQSFKFGNVLFNKKFSRTHRVLNAATFTYSPYTIPGYSIGSELFLIKEFSRKQNRSLKLIVNEKEEWGDVFENETGTGVFGAVVSEKAEIGFSAIFLWESKYKHFEFSHAFIRSGVTCLLPKPKIFIGWTALLPYYSHTFQICIITTYVLATLTLLMFRFFWEHRRSEVSGSSVIVDACLDIARIFIEGREPAVKKYQLKIVLWLIIWSAMLLSIVFSGKLSSTLIIPSYTGSVDTVEQLAASNYEWSGTQSGAWIESIIGDFSPIYMKVISKFIEVKAEKMVLSPTLGFAVERLPSGYFAIGKYIKLKWLKSLKIMKNDLYYAHCPIILRKNSFLLEPLNKFILQAKQAGLNIYWESKTVVQFENMHKQIALKFNSDDARKVNGLTLTHFRGVFFIWSFGTLVSIIIFIYESSHIRLS